MEMAGPIASVLFETFPSEWTWAEIVNLVQTISGKVEGDEFWVITTKWIKGTVERIDGRPFGMDRHKIDSNNNDYSKEEVLTMQKSIGFDPKFFLSIYAMCNEAIDHKILGELTHYLAKRYNGLIDFKGKLPSLTLPRNGNLWDIPYQVSEDRRAVYQIGDVDFLWGWLQNENFRMIK